MQLGDSGSKCVGETSSEYGVGLAKPKDINWKRELAQLLSKGRSSLMEKVNKSTSLLK